MANLNILDVSCLNNVKKGWIALLLVTPQNPTIRVASDPDRECTTKVFSNSQMLLDHKGLISSNGCSIARFSHNTNCFILNVRPKFDEPEYLMKYL